MVEKKCRHCGQVMMVEKEAEKAQVSHIKCAMEACKEAAKHANNRANT